LERIAVRGSEIPFCDAMKVALFVASGGGRAAQAVRREVAIQRVGAKARYARVARTQRFAIRAVDGSHDAQVKPHELPAWQAVAKAAAASSSRPHLKELMGDLQRCLDMFLEYDGILMDYSRQLLTLEEKQLLLELAAATNVEEKIAAMFRGDKINVSEDRSVLHVALRAARESTLEVDGVDVVAEVYAVLDRIKEFSDAVRSGEHVGATGKAIKDVICIGIGGSFLGPAFVHTALETEPSAQRLASGRRLRFLANVDPEDVARALSGLNAETTLVVVVSKTFTTAETMLNARTVRAWLQRELGSGKDVVAKHMVAVSTNANLVKKYGIDENNMFVFWDWVGGRYSVSSAVGVLPLALQYGYEMVEQFLTGMRSVDQHFRTARVGRNIPVMMGLLGVWNATFLGFPTNALLPYDQALSKLAPHIQQVAMESNGKGVFLDGTPVPFATGEIIFGEPGTNGQHSFYQLIHQGRTMPCDFIGVSLGQQNVYLEGEPVSNHDELMSNFFAQADALAYGKTLDEVRAENPTLDETLLPHKVFHGNRPSLSILLPKLTAYEIGQLLALYEHRVAVEGFVWGINSFDQWGVELGKILATKMRQELSEVRRYGRPLQTAGKGFNYSTSRMLQAYLKNISERRALLYSDAFNDPFEYFNSCVGDECVVE